jgi:transcriptional regulator with XRE-family HTH domain
MSQYEFFAKTLKACMQQAGINNSELARRVWGSITDNRGYSVARNRQRISDYLLGTSYPEPYNLWKIAGALGVPLEHLAFEFLTFSTDPPTIVSPIRRMNTSVAPTNARVE